MLGKTFKGMTDEMLGWQTEKLLELETSPRRPHGLRAAGARRRGRVRRRPAELRAIPGGLALRFARVKGYRPDKSAAEADTIQTVRQLATSS